MILPSKIGLYEFRKTNALGVYGFETLRPRDACRRLSPPIQIVAQLMAKPMKKGFYIYTQYIYISRRTHIYIHVCDRYRYMYT